MKSDTQLFLPRRGYVCCVWFALIFHCHIYIYFHFSLPCSYFPSLPVVSHSFAFTFPLQLLKGLARQRPVSLYCDFHGHSCIKDAVIYGCDELEGNVQQDDLSEAQTIPPRYQQLKAIAPKWKGRPRLFPYLIGQKSPDIFDPKRCRYTVMKAKDNSARVSAFLCCRFSNIIFYFHLHLLSLLSIPSIALKL